MGLIEPAWLCLLSLFFITVYCDDQLSLDLVAAGSDVVDGNYTLDSCRNINCTSYNVTEFHVNIEWSTITIYKPFSVLAAASRLHNTSAMLIIDDDDDYLRHKGQRLRIPESPIVRFPWQRNPDKWRMEKGLKPMSEITPEDQLGVSLEISKTDQFEFCESEKVMSRGERDMLVNIVTNLGWKKLVIICDQSTEFETMELSSELSEHGITLTILAINETASSYTTYPGLKTTYDLFGDEQLDVVLLCSLGCVKTILNEANGFDVEQKNLTAIRHSSRWLVAHYGYDQNYLEKSGITLDNVAVLTGPSYHECYPTNIKKVLPHVVQAALRKVDSEPDYSGDVTVDGYVKSEIRSILENPTINTNLRLATLIWKEGGRRQLDNVDIGVDGKGNIFPNAAFGFNQRVFYVATLEYAPFVIKTVTNGTAVYTGLCMDLLWQLAITLNFSYVMIEPPDGEWGRVNDGKWTGLIGQVAYQEADMILAAVTVSNEREAVMDFTFPYYFGYSVVFFRKPDPNADKWYTLLAPFTWQVLLCIFCAVIFVGFLLYSIERFNPFYEKMYPKRKHVGLQSTMWYLYGALLSHGGNGMPEAAAGRLVISTWWLFCMICAATYSGNLIAFLTVTTKEVPFSTLAEMVANDEYTWGYLQGSFLETLFKNSNLPTYQNVWEGIKRFSENNPDHLHPSIDAHFDRMMSSKYAVIDDGSSIFSWSEHQCDIEILNERFFPNHYALGLPNQSPFTSLISNQMIKIYESGLLQVWQQNWWPKTKFCKGSLTTETEAIDLQSLQSAFYVLCIGLFLALVILGIEFIRRCTMKDKKPTHLGEGEKQH